MDSVVNHNGVELKVGDYWTMESKPSEYFPNDDTWIMRIRNIQPNGLVPVDYVNWKRKGKGISYSRMASNFGSIPSLRKSTEEETSYFNSRFS